MRSGPLKKVSWLLILAFLTSAQGYADTHASDTEQEGARWERPLAPAPKSDLKNILQARKASLDAETAQLALLERELAKARFIHDGLWWVAVPVVLYGLYFAVGSAFGILDEAFTRPLTWLRKSMRPVVLLGGPAIVLRLTDDEKSKLESEIAKRKIKLEELRNDLARREAEAGQ